MNLIPTLVSIGLAASISFLYLQKQKDQPDKINNRAALSKFEQSALAFAASIPLNSNAPLAETYCQNINSEFGRQLAAGSQWTLDITGLDCDIALLSLTSANADDFATLMSAATESGRAQDAQIDYSNRTISWTQRIYSRKASDLGFNARLQNNTLGTCLFTPCTQTNNSTSLSQPSVEPGWTDFGNWDECERGSQQRERVCINANPQAGINCSGSATENRTCNRAPTAENMTVTVSEQTASEVRLAGSGPDNDPLTYSIISGPSEGSVSVTGSTATYTSDSDTATKDNFAYRVCDTINFCAQARVFINIQSVNDRPTSQDLFITATERQMRFFYLIGEDPENDALTYVITTNPQYGTVGNSGTKASYISTSNIATSDRFTYKVCDPEPSCSQSTVTINITPVNDPPTGQNSTVYIEEGQTIVIFLYGSDVDSDNDKLSYQISNPPRGGYTHSGRRVTYTAVKDELIVWGKGSIEVIDNFNYKVCDNQHSCSKEDATVTIKTTQVNATPMFMTITPEKQRARATVGMDYSYEFEIIDTDYEFGSNEQEEVTFTKPNWLELDKDNVDADKRIYKAKLSGSPKRKNIKSFDNGVTITAKDGWGIDIEDFTIEVKPPKPTAQNQQVDVYKNQSVDILLGLVNMGDYSYTYKIEEEPQYGKLDNERISYNYTFITYTPNTPSYSSQDSFKFVVCDLDVCSKPTTVTITIKN